MAAHSRPSLDGSCRVCIAALLLMATGADVRGAEIETASTAPRFALIIGVGRYPALEPGEQLSGSRNDVAAMRQLLVDRFAFDARQVTTLVDEQATGAGIRAALQQLTDEVGRLPVERRPAQVVIHFSGHGSQIPDQSEGPDRDEEDGLDETWVPHDATRQGGPEDIRDDEINHFVQELCAEGQTRLLVVSDCCHSGTGARGTMRTRQLRRSITPTAPVAAGAVIQKRLGEGVVFLSACRASEVEPEFQDDGQTYGLLTRFLVEALSEERVVSQLSYDLLQKAIIAHYQRDRRVLQAPIPQLEGSSAALQSTILGFGPDVDRPPYYEVERTTMSARVLLRAGKFQHITAGSLFELYDRPEYTAGATTGLAWLKIVQVDGTTSVAQVIRWEDPERTSAVEDALPATFKTGYASLRYQDPGETGLRLKVVRASRGTRDPGASGDSDPLGPNDPSLPPAVTAALTRDQPPGERKWLQWVTESRQSCDVVLRIDGNYAALFPAIGIADLTPADGIGRGEVPASLRGGWGPFDLRTGLGAGDPPQSLSDYLRRITRARNLISLARGGHDAGTSDNYVRLQLLSGTYDEDSGKFSDTKPWEPNREGVLAMHEDAVYALRVVNTQEPGTPPVYVSVLTISPNMGIEAILPYEEPLVKLEAGEARLSDPFRCTGPHGPNHAILLVTREPADFRFVAQPDLLQTRGATPQGGAGILTEQLAEFTGLQLPATRGRRLRKTTTDTTWHAEILSWMTSP